MAQMYTAEVVADSISPDGHRITSVKVIYPHAVHKDMLRHRNQNRNVESFRAQPPEKLIENLKNGGAFIPDVFAKRTKGMGQSIEKIEDAAMARDFWLDHLGSAIRTAKTFLDLGIAKQQINFVLQDFCPLTEIITATDWDNFFALRMDENEDGTPVARPEVYKTVREIYDAIQGSTPQKLDYSQIHLPFVTDKELSILCETRNIADYETIEKDEQFWISVSAGRCARISYGDYKWWEEPRETALKRSERLLQSGHMSPFEQQARPFSIERWNLVKQLEFFANRSPLPEVEKQEMLRQLEYSGNLHGWVPVRKTFPNEHNYALIKDAMISG